MFAGTCGMTGLPEGRQYKSLLLACSGLLGYRVLKYLYDKENIAAVLTDKNSTEINTFCNKMNIPRFKGNARTDECVAFVEHYKDSILFSVNYLFLFDKRIITLFKYRFNIHGSLLPKYSGRTPHVWAIINNEKKTGITIHEISLECDSGDILFQKEIPIKYSDTGGSILQKYYFLYPKILAQFLLLFREGKIVGKKQEKDLMTYFDKRTPEDGRVNWDWQRERIYNWVRALAPPYPGAFCFLKNTKIIINRILFSDHGFFFSIDSGTIVDILKDSFIVKTPNGCIEIIDYSITDNIRLSKGDVLT
jgi:methionyl-tRNA formyltransferase